MKRTLRIGLGFSALAIFSSAAIANAQTHPCDSTNPTIYPVHRADVLKIGFCEPAVDDAGDPVPLGAIRFLISNVTTGAVGDLGLLQPQGGPNGNGLYYYEAAIGSFAADANVRVIAQYNGVDALSPTVTIDVRGGPKPPTNLRVVVQ